MTDEEMEELRVLIARAAAATPRRQHYRDTARPFDRTWDRIRAQVECQGKHPFPSYSQAAATIRPDMRKVVQAYQCRTCGKFHIGSIEANRKKRLALKWKKEKHS